MKKIATLAFSFFLFPLYTFAACTEVGVTVVYVNGIFTSRTTAQSDLEKIRKEYFERTGDSSTKFINGYNPSHLEGVADVVQSYTQIVGKPIGTYDLKNILLQIHPQLTTRRVLLVGHSQGSFYANEIYKYFLSHGVPREAVLTYVLAAPSYEVAPGGVYLNSKNDALLNKIENDLGIPLLARNITISVTDADTKSRWPGHGITKAYLAQAPGRVIGDMQAQIAKLEPVFPSEKGECFSAPADDFVFKATGLALGTGDLLASGIKKGGELGVKAAAAAVAGVKKVASDIGTTIGGLKAISKAADGSTDSRAANFKILDALYGSSLNSQELRELLGEGGGGAVATAPIVRPQPKVEGVVAGEQTEAPAPARRYVSSANGEAEEPEVEETPEPEPPVEEESGEEPAPPEEPTEEEEEPEAPPEDVFVGGFSIEDDFDSGLDGWAAFGMSGVVLHATTTGCFAGNCVAGDTMSPQAARMYKTGDALEEGAFTVYVRAREGSFTPNFNPLPVVDLCVAGDACLDGGRIQMVEHEDLDDEWHQYLVAWRQGAEFIETCVLRDTTDVELCEWEPSEKPAGASVNGVLLMSAFGYRPDLGGEFWFDELESYEL